MGFLLQPSGRSLQEFPGIELADSALSDPLAGTVNDLSVNDSQNVSCIILRASAAFTLNGLVGGQSQRKLLLVNQSAFDGEIAANAGGSVATNRFAGEATLAAGTAVQLIYNAALGLWIVSGSGSGGGGGGGDVDTFVALVGAAVIAPAALAAGTTADWDPAGLATCRLIKVTTDNAGSALGGIATHVPGQLLTLCNVGPTGDLTLLNLSGGSAAANRIQGIVGTDIALPVGDSITLFHDDNIGRWRKAT